MTVKVNFIKLNFIIKTLFLFFCFLTFFSCASSKHVTDSSAESDKNLNSAEDESKKTSSVSKTKSDLNSSVKNNESTIVSEFSNALKLNDESSVLKEGSKLLSQDSKNVKVLNALAMFYFKKGRIPLAKLYLSKAINAANEKSSEVYNNLGIIHLSEGETREALMAFKRGYQINAQDPLVAANLGNMYAVAKDYRKAKVALETAYKGGVQTVSTLNNYAISLVSEGHFEEANKIYKSIVDQNSGEIKLQLNYAIFLVDHKRDYSMAQDFIDKIRFMGFSTEDRKLIDGLEAKVQSGRK
jgi:Flp pilus assembly protein TadD